MNTEVKKVAVEAETIVMTDGRSVTFAGKRKVIKETLIDESKINVDMDSITMEHGAVSIRMDFRNGETRTMALPLSLMARFAGHGAEQKYGDELATTADKPLSEDDMVVAIDDLDASLQAGNWNRGRASSGGGVSGASIVIRAIMEVKNKDAATVKAFLQAKLDADPTLTRNALYAAFRAPGTKTGEVIARMEAEKQAKAVVLNADEALDGL